MSWNPFQQGQPWDGGLMPPQGMPAQSPDFGALAQAFGQQYKANQLGGGGVTLGNEQAQQDYAQQLAQALADGDFSSKQIDRAAGMMSPEFIQNSGIAGVADMILKTYAGKKMDEKARKLQADAEARRMAAQEGVDERRAVKDAERADATSTRERTRRSFLAQQMGLNRREALEFIETGKVPKAVRGVPMMTDQGLVNVDPYTGEYKAVSQQGQQLPPNVNIDPRMSPEDRAIALADATNNPADPHGETVDYGKIQRPGQGPLMPYKDPAVAQQQAANNARADEQLRLSQGAARRADEQFAWQKEQAAKKDSAPNSSVSAMQQDALNFAAAYMGKSPEDVAKMTPEDIRTEVAKGGRTMAGPIAGKIPGAGLIFNADLEAYANSAAGKQARLNNPTGPVSNADFEVARKSVFSPEKPAEVNADLIYQALTRGLGQSAPASAGSETVEKPQRIRIKL